METSSAPEDRTLTDKCPASQNAKKDFVVGICAFNEGEKIQRVIRKFNRYDVYDVVIVNDGSTDGSLDRIPEGAPVHIIHNQSTCGAGFGVRQIIDYAQGKGYVAVFFVSGNDKDRPQDIEHLRKAVLEGYDLVQGSRYLDGGDYAQMPVYRIFATRILHPMLFSLLTAKRLTDTTNGFRALRLSILDDPRINIDQKWLDHYELEPYLLFKAVKLNFKVKEVPVVKIYPPKAQGYTKMRPFSGWWSILRPLVYLGCGIKR